MPEGFPGASNPGGDQFCHAGGPDGWPDMCGADGYDCVGGSDVAEDVPVGVPPMTPRSICEPGRAGGIAGGPAIGPGAGGLVGSPGRSFDSSFMGQIWANLVAGNTLTPSFVNVLSGSTKRAFSYG